MSATNALTVLSLTLPLETAEENADLCCRRDG